MEAYVDIFCHKTGCGTWFCSFSIQIAIVLPTMPKIQTWFGAFIKWSKKEDVITMIKHKTELESIEDYTS